jgi:hypothetical protein
MALSTNKIGNVPDKVTKALALINDKDLHPVDIIADCGLSSIYTGSEGGTKQYNDEDDVDVSELYETKNLSSATTLMTNYKSVINAFLNFATQEKTVIFIGDILRHILVKGDDKKILSDKTKSFSKNVFWPMKHLTSTFNTSYGAIYNNWVKVYDDGIEKHAWVPISGIMSSVFCNTDTNSVPWAAPAGFDRGVIAGITDIALNTNQEQRDELYNISVNSIASFPNDGYVVFGQKTLQTKPSAFDRINVRRLFLYLEKLTDQTVKHFVFEPNTFTTRSKIINVLEPIFETAKTSIIQGIYDYKIVCDATNNTPSVIDSNELVVDIFIKPTRTAEFILVNFYATRTDQNFVELIS